MTDTPSAEPTVSIPAPAGNDAISLSDAARALSDFRWKRNQQAEAPPTEAPDAPDPAPEDTPDPALEADATPPEADSGQDAPEPVEAAEPPIDPPKSWTKDAIDHWSKLPRATQEYLAQRESERDRGLAQSQQKAADERKAVQAERAAAEQARAQYEAQLPALMDALQGVNAQHFGDVRTVDDVTKLAAEDPFRYLQWQAHQQKLAAVKAEQDAAQRRQADERQSSWQRHVTDETAKFNDNLSESDKGKIKGWSNAAPQFLQDRGFTQSELANLANGTDKLSIFDHRVQSLLLDALKFRDVQSARTKMAQKPLPPATRPGTNVPVSSNAAKISELSKQLDRASGMQAVRLAAQLTQLKRKG